MSNPVFVAAQQTSRIVNREKELETLRRAICVSDDETRVVIIKAPGGIGKTRLLSEALWLAGNPNIFPQREPLPPEEAWSVTGSVIVSDLLDLTETRLHTFDNFIDSLRRAFVWHPGGNFTGYDTARAAYRRRRQDQVDYHIIKEAADRAQKSFFEDYEKIALDYRLVWALDTAEQLHFPGVPWLKEKGLLTPTDLDFSTRERLLELLETEKLPNTTILLAGRPSAEDYFEEVRKLAKEGHFVLEEIELGTFTEQDTIHYLRQLADDYRDSKGKPHYDPDFAVKLDDILQDIDLCRVLHLYTGGQPVRLALFADVLAEGKQEPEALQDTLAEARQRVGWDDKTGQPDPQKLKQARYDVEEAFINLIFAGAQDLRSQILTALVRARRGLDIGRLDFILNSLPDATRDGWQSSPAQREAIEAEMALSQRHPHSVQRLSFVKRGGGNRLILQDELYRIFDDHMAGSDATRRREADIRRKLYRKLHSYAEWEIARLKAKRTQNRREDERALRFETPARALSLAFPYLGEEEEAARARLEEHILEAGLERLHYLLRVDPDEGFNDDYGDLAEQMWRAGNQEADAQVQIELWRFLNDPYARQFIDLKPRHSMVPDSTPWQTLERAAQQEDVTRWLKRFFLRREYKRVLTFADGVEAILNTLPEPLRITLDHTFSRGERICWQETARIYVGENVPAAINKLEETTLQLKRLLRGGIPERNEYDFQGHPAEIRVRRVIGVTYTALAYAHNTRGNYRRAAQANAEALRYLRDTGFLAQKAVTRNNLSRVLSEMGLIARAVRICRDGLQLKEELGSESQIAISHSTLALIYNNGLQPENAWREAALAVVYFRKLEERRGLGLTLLHLGEALRRLATSTRPQADTPEQLFDAALAATSEAVQIFDKSPEVMRRIEAAIEQGCLYRDYMHHLKPGGDAPPSDRFRLYRNRALNTLRRAVELAKEKKYPRHRLDAQVNLAWTYYYAGDTQAAEEAIDASLALVPDTCTLKPGSPPPTTKDAEPYTFMMLGKVWTARSRLRMDRFLAAEKVVAGPFKDKQAEQLAVSRNKAARQTLQEAAEAFVLALAYNQLYSIRSAILSVSFDVLYAYLKKFNATELEDFFKFQRQARETYRLDEIEPEDMTNLETFLLQSFGDFFSPIPDTEEVGQ